MLEKLIVKGYIPLKKKGVSSISIDAKSIFNIILGRNGYGKTSLLRMMNPFPPDNADFEDGGYKEIHYRIKNNYFELSSTTGKKSDHKFVLNGKNLNEGGTLLVQRDLVKHYFNITNDVKNVLTGIDRADNFTALSTQRRKNVLMEVNPNDTKYGLKIYDKARVALNQTKGALKHQRQRLAVEMKRQTDLKSLSHDELQEEISRLDGVIRNALLLHGSLQGIEDHDLKPLTTRLSGIASRLLGSSSKKLYPPSYYLERIERTQVSINRDKEYESGLQALLRNVVEKVNNFNVPDGMTLKGYEEKIEEGEKVIDTLTKRRVELEEMIHREEFFNTEEWKEEQFKYALPNFLSLVQAVEITEDKDLSAQGYVVYQKTHKEWVDKINAIEKEIDNHVHALRHYENAEAVECPDCNKKFKVGFAKVNPVQIKTAIEDLSGKLVKYQEEAKKISDLLERNEGWFETMGNLMRWIKHSSEPRYVLEIIKLYEVGKVTQNVLLNIFKMMEEWYDVDKQYDEVLSRQSTLKAQYRLMSESDIGNLNDEYDRLSVELGKTQKNIKRLGSLLNQFEDSLETIREEQALTDVYVNTFNELQDLLFEKGKYKIKQRVQEVLNLLTPQKDKLLGDLIRAESLSSVITSIEENIVELEKRERHLKVIVDGLSPVKGLIGELMVDFLNSLCANVNACIEPIWTDPLRLQSCFIEGEGDDLDLDYKFPFTSGDEKRPNEDISKGSGGEKEIIDFMIRRVLLRYKGERCGVPLIMDEVGITFDELHRSRFIGYIQDQLRMDKLPQTFMISHYVNQYGSFNDRDVNVIALNTKGLTVPDVLNKNTIIS